MTAFRAKTSQLALSLLTLVLLSACSSTPRPPAKAVPPETIQVNPELIKPAPEITSTTQPSK